ncbi:MAG: hypothetical protein U1A78_18695 [Polyangia bacterium]
MGGSRKLSIACWLLVGCMAPVFVEWRYGELLPADPVIWIVTLITAGIALWAYFKKRAGWVVAVIRAVLQILVAALALMEISGSGTRATVYRLQALSTLALVVAALWLLLDKQVRELVWGSAAKGEPPAPAPPPRPPSWLAGWRVPAGLGGVALVAAALEQRLLYQHLTLGEWLLRVAYVLLPVLGAWLLAVRGRDRLWLTTLGALLGECVSDMLSVLVSGGGLEAALMRVVLPIYSLPALLLGLAVGLGARRPLPFLGIVVPVGYVLYRTSSTLIASGGGALPVGLWGLSALTGVGFAAVIFRFRSARADTPA